MSSFSAPMLLTSRHDSTRFASTEPMLDDWLRKRALANQASGASRTFVIVDKDDVICAYYSLAAGAVDHASAVSAIRRNMPDPVPVMVLGRLAVDERFHGVGMGADLLRDVVLRTTRLAQEVGIRALLVHALHDRAKAFYLKHGFSESGMDPLMLMLRVRVAEVGEPS